jgi:hypothetical protein
MHYLGEQTIKKLRDRFQLGRSDKSAAEFMINQIRLSHENQFRYGFKFCYASNAFTLKPYENITVSLSKIIKFLVACTTASKTYKTVFRFKESDASKPTISFQPSVSFHLFWLQPRHFSV